MGSQSFQGWKVNLHVHGIEKKETLMNSTPTESKSLGNGVKQSSTFLISSISITKIDNHWSESTTTIKVLGKCYYNWNHYSFNSVI